MGIVMKKKFSFVFVFVFIFMAFSEDSKISVLLENFQNSPPNMALTEARNQNFFKSVKIEIVSSLEKTISGVVFKNPAAARFYFLEGSVKKPIVGAFVTVCYPEKDCEKIITSYKTLKTDKNGFLSFKLPVFDSPLFSEVKFILQIFSKNSKAPVELKLLTKEELESVSVSFPCKVGGKKRNGLKASISIADFNENGSCFSRNMVSSTLMKELMCRRYFWVGNYESGILKNKNRSFEDVLLRAKKDFSSNVKDFIFGRAEIISLKKDDTCCEATCQAKIKVWDMLTDTLRTEFTCKTTATGNSPAQATMNSREKLGIILADLIEFGFEFQ